MFVATYATPLSAYHQTLLEDYRPVLLDQVRETNENANDGNNDDGADDNRDNEGNGDDINKEPTLLPQRYPRTRGGQTRQVEQPWMILPPC